MRNLYFCFIAIILMASFGLSFQQPSIQKPPNSSVARPDHANHPNGKQEPNNAQAVTQERTITTPGQKHVVPLDAQKEPATCGKTTEQDKPNNLSIGDKIAIGAIFAYLLQLMYTH